MIDHAQGTGEAGSISSDEEKRAGLLFDLSIHDHNNNNNNNNDNGTI